MKITGDAQNKGFKDIQQGKTIRHGMAMPRVWYILLNRKNALIFREEDRHLIQIADITPDENEDNEGRQRTLGHVAGGDNTVYYTSNPRDRTRNHEAGVFLGNVASWLLAAHHEDAFDKLVLAAAPEALGIVRTKLDPHLVDLILHEINKDLLNLPLPELEAMLIGYGRKLH